VHSSISELSSFAAPICSSVSLTLSIIFCISSSSLPIISLISSRISRWGNRSISYNLHSCNTISRYGKKFPANARGGRINFLSRRPCFILPGWMSLPDTLRPGRSSEFPRLSILSFAAGGLRERLPAPLAAPGSVSFSVRYIQRLIETNLDRRKK